MIEKKKKYKLSDFRYQLPKKFIAQKPKQKRDGSKMMVLNREDKSIKHRIDLKNGSLLVMDGNTQKNYKHGVPIQKKIKQSRINLTFRNVV